MRKYLSVLILSLLATWLPVSQVRAADFDIFGQLVVEDIKAPSLVMNDLAVHAYIVGKSDVFFGDLDFEDDMQFRMDINDLAVNDQLIIIGEGRKADSAYFGSATTVITEKELKSGLVGNLIINMNELPIPAYETSNENLIKVCWKGLDQFSVVGYEVYRSEFIDEGWEAVGRSGQNADKQVCYVDNTADEDVKYFYKIGALTSWSAGEGKEVMVSEVMSLPSNGMMIGLGEVEEIYQTDVIGEKETDLSPMVVSGVDVNDNFGQLDTVLEKINQFIDERGWSHEIFMIVLLSGILLLVVVFFVVSVSLANVRSQGSNLWDKK